MRETCRPALEGLTEEAGKLIAKNINWDGVEGAVIRSGSTLLDEGTHKLGFEQ